MSEQDENRNNDSNVDVVTTTFNNRFTNAYERVSSSGWSGLAHHGTLLIMLISAAISSVWFATLVPGLILDPSKYPTLARALSGFIGVAMMEGASVIWHYLQERQGLSKSQLNIAQVGKWIAIAASVVTSFVAISSLIGGNQDAVTTAVLSFANGSGIGYYIALQFALFVIYRFSGTESVRARHAAHVAANQAAITQKTEKAISNSQLAAAEVLSDDMATLGKFGAVSSHQEQLEVMRKQLGIEGELADQLFAEIAQDNHGVEAAKSKSWRDIFRRPTNGQ